MQKLHKKLYASPAEEGKWKKQFAANLDVITKHNALFTAGKTTFQMGLHEYSDKNPADVLKTRTGLKVPKWVFRSIVEFIDWSKLIFFFHRSVKKNKVTVGRKTR